MSFFSRLRTNTPVYKNTGSTARDHLASERTYLSWLRTGLGFIALGIAIERFSQLDIPEILATLRHDPALNSAVFENTQNSQQKRSQENQKGEGKNKQEKERRQRDAGREKDKDHLLVGALLGTGAGSIVYGTTRYFTNLRALERGLFKPAYLGVAGSSTLLAGLAGVVYVSAAREHGKGER